MNLFEILVFSFGFVIYLFGKLYYPFINVIRKEENTNYATERSAMSATVLPPTILRIGSIIEPPPSVVPSAK